MGVPQATPHHNLAREMMMQMMERLHDLVHLLQSRTHKEIMQKVVVVVHV